MRHFQHCPHPSTVYASERIYPLDTYSSQHPRSTPYGRCRGRPRTTRAFLPFRLTVKYKPTTAITAVKMPTTNAVFPSIVNPLSPRPPSGGADENEVGFDVEVVVELEESEVGTSNPFVPVTVGPVTTPPLAPIVLLPSTTPKVPPNPLPLNEVATSNPST